MAENTYKTRKYSVEPYDPAWAAWFEKTAASLEEAFGSDAVAIEHIGSTAVAGMAGKAALDILILVPEIAVVDAHVVDMKRLGYEDAGEFVMKNSRFFRKFRGEELVGNVHVFPEGHPHVAEMLGLRDYLRAHPEEVAAYSKLKQKLYKKYPENYSKYREEKDAYVDALVERAKSEQ